MIQVSKRKEIPYTLARKGLEATLRLIDGQRSHKAILKFDRRIYAAHDVKKALREDQHQKCCFCEERIVHTSKGTVEHFRPKAATQQTELEPLQKPGYYWLAYDWENLLFCCQLCNEVYKRNYFPLAAPSRRAASPDHPLEDEGALLIHPCEDPQAHIVFFQFSIAERNSSERGRQTILKTGLNRVELELARKEYLENLGALLELIVLHRASIDAGEVTLASQLEPLAKQALQRLRQALLPSARFSAMIRDNFAHLIG